jgi:hypothetical protein
MKTVFIFGIVLLAIFIFVLSYIPLGIEPLTEVYFENHTKLPVYLFLDKPYNYTFSVHNLEYQEMRYTYTIDAFDENGTYLYNMDKDEFILSNNQTRTINEQFVMPGHFNKTQIVINVSKDLSLERPKFKDKLWWPDPNYPMNIDIHFWVEEIEGPTITIIKGKA